MATEIRLPQWAMGLREGTVSHWLKAVGDYVEAGEAVVEVDEAKVTDVIPAPEAGYLLEILVQEGETVPVRTPICLIGSQDELQSEAHPLQATTQSGTTSATSQSTSNGVDKQQLGTVENEIRLSGMRGVVAQRMADSLHNSAQFTLTMQADVTELLSQREILNAKEGAHTADGVIKITLTDVILKATALTLKNHPRLNGWVDGEKVRLVSEIHMGLAVALQEGLIVPVLCNADRKTLQEIAAKTKLLAEKSRENNLTAEEISGSTFTITNLGMYGVDFFTPIINLPEIAILGVGAVADYPLRHAEGLIWRKYLPLSLTIDHRAVDGAPAAVFLRDLKDYLEQINLETL